MTSVSLPIAFLLLASPVRARELGPWIVDETSTSARVCSREDGRDACQSLTGLTPGAPFEYTASSRTYVAATLPAAGAPLHFAVFGDAGMGTVGQRKVAAVLAKRSPDLVVFTGDVAYPSGNENDYAKKYFGVYGKALARIPVFPCPGNHDYGNVRKSASLGERRLQDGYARVFQRPKYYSFDAGPAHFVSLDTNAADGVKAAEPVDLDSRQRRWLEKDLRASKARWKFVFMHVPLFSTYFNHGDNAGLRASLQSLFERYRVDAVFAGHDHVYQRSRRMNGVLYLTVGTGGGTIMGGPLDGRPWLEKEVVSFGLADVRVDAKRLSLRFLDQDGRERDSYDVDKP